MKFSPLSVSDDYFKKIDLSSQKDNIFDDLKKIPNLAFLKKTVWESRYWGKRIGAFQIEGNFKFKKNKITPVIIKIQGSKPLISEAKIIEKLSLIKDKKIRFPRIVFYQPWNPKKKYEITVFEKINADFIVKPHKLSTNQQIKEFFFAYQTYQNFSKKITPFIEKPKEKINYFDLFLKWRKIRLENYLQFLISKKEDDWLLKLAKRLDFIFKKNPLFFQHCHLSIYDLKKKNGKFCLFSNLFWGWRWRFYDAVFGFIWYLLGISFYKNNEVLSQIKIWENFIMKINKNDQKVKIALIERYLAALNLDILMINKKENILRIKKILLDKLKEKIFF